MPNTIEPENQTIEINDNPFPVGTDAELDAAEAKFRADYEAANTNSSVTETKPDASETPEPTKVSAEAKEVEAPAEEAEEHEAKQELEAEAEPKETEPTDKPKPKVRPWSELRKTRKANDQLINELETERKARRDLENRFKLIESKISPVQPKAQNQVPEFTKDPLENLNQRTDLTAKQLQEINQRLAIQQIQAEINADEANYTKDVPDYTEARDWLLDQERRDALTVFGGLPEEQRNLFANNLVDQRRSILIATARETKSSVADLAYKVAQARGYKSKASSAAEVKPEVKPAPVVAREKVLAQKEREAIASGSLSQVGASPNLDRKISREDIMSMSEKELDQMADKYGDDWTEEQIA